MAALKTIGSLPIIRGEEGDVTKIINNLGNQLDAVGIETSSFHYTLGDEEGRPVAVIRLRCTPEDAAVARALLKREIRLCDEFRSADNHLLACARG